MLLTVGCATLVLLLDKVTTVLLGAGATSVTVPVTLLPPLIVLGFRLTDFTPTTTLVSSDMAGFTMPQLCDRRYGFAARCEEAASPFRQMPLRSGNAETSTTHFSK
jgi:hypothetical protein